MAQATQSDTWADLTAAANRKQIAIKLAKTIESCSALGNLRPFDASGQKAKARTFPK